VARYSFITPDVCHDMHDDCASLNDRARQGDAWPSTEVPKNLASQAYASESACATRRHGPRTSSSPKPAPLWNSPAALN